MKQKCILFSPRLLIKPRIWGCREWGSSSLRVDRVHGHCRHCRAFFNRVFGSGDVGIGWIVVAFRIWSFSLF